MVFKVAGKKSWARVEGIRRHQVESNSLAQYQAERLPLNGIRLMELTFDEPLVLDSYRSNCDPGGLIIIDRLRNETIGAGLMRKALLKAKDSALSAFALEPKALMRRHFPYWDARDLLGGQ